MNISIINKRKAYTNNELINMVKVKMTEQGLNEINLYEKYCDFFMDRTELDRMLKGETYFNYNIYEFLENYLDIPINELTRIIEDDSSEVSARGNIDVDFLKMLNYLFDQMIKHRNFNSISSNAFTDYLKFSSLKKDNIDAIIPIVKEYLSISSVPIDLFDVLDKKEGFYILKFPNDLGVSGLTMIKNSRNENEKYICIYINTNELKGRLKFTLAHELYHVLIEKSHYQASFLKDRDSDEIEKRAEEFASKLIIPRGELLRFIANNIKTNKHRDFIIDDIVKIQNYFEVSFQSIVYVLSSSLQQDENYRKYINKIPKVNHSFKRYYNSHRSPKIQEELLRNTGDKTTFNSIKDSFETPKLFLSDLEKSYSKKLISLEEYKFLNNFFDKED